MAELVATFVVGLAGVSLGALLARRNEKRAASERLLADALNDVVGGVADEANGMTGAQARYASGMARMALHGSPRVVSALAQWQREATTTTPRGKRLLATAVIEARRELRHGEAEDDDLSLLLFGTDARSLDPTK
jgi:hypothetical protein